MSTQLAARLQPYFNYIVVGQLLLIAIVAAWAFLIIIKRVRTRSAPGDLMMDADTIAGEITHEISRLHDLRKRLSSKFNEATGGDAGIVASASSGPAVTGGGSAADGALPAGDHKAIEQQIEARYLDTVTDLKNQIQKHEQEKAELTEKINAAGSVAGGGNDAPKIETDAALKEVKELKDKLEVEKTEAKEKVLHLERVISEYRLFEEDFALVKRYKAENDRLKKQLTESHQVTEDDISKLFGAMDTGDAPSSVGVDPRVSADNFFGSEFEATPKTETTADPAAVAASVAQAAPEPSFKTADTAAPTGSEIEDELAKLLAETSTEPAVESAPAPAAGVNSATSSAVSTAAAAAASVAAEPVVKIVPAAVEPAVISAAPVPSKDFEVDRLKDEPHLNSSRIDPEEDLEAMAEAAGSDDKLLEEFQKILGDKS